MASVIIQLATIILVAIAIQTLVTANDLQEYDEYEESDVSYLRSLIDKLKILTLRPQSPSSSESNEDIVEVESSGFEDAYDDDRQSRSHPTHTLEMQEHYCMTVTKQEMLSDSNFEYRPTVQEEKYCQPVVGVPPHNQKGLCYVRGKGCHTVTKEVSFFKRQRQSNHCWRPEIRNVSVGCKCYFDRHNLRGKTYVG